MAIETVEIITRDGMSIGLSKTLDNLYNDGDLTPQELAKFSYAAWEALECNAYATTEINISSQQGAAVTSQLSYFQSPMGGSNIVSAYVNDLLPTNRLYCFNILLYTDNYYENLTIDNTSDCAIVTDIDLTKCAMTLNSAPSENGDVNIDYPDSQTIKRFTSGASSYFHNDDLVKHWNGSSWVSMSNIRPYCVIANDSGIIFITQGSYFGDREISGFGTVGYNFCPINSLKLPEGNQILEQKWYYSQGDIVDYTKTKHLLRWIGNDQEYESQTWEGGSKRGAWSYDDNFFVIMNQTNQVYGIANDAYHIYPKSLDVVKRLIACVGLNVYIGNDKSSVIKPIIEGGLVVGYSEDASTPSEIDNITNVVGNNISPFSPGGGGGGGDDDDPSDDQAWGGAYSGAGAFSKFYLCTATDLANLRTWFGGGGSGDQIPDGFDPMGQVIGLLQYPISISGTALAPDEIIFRSGKTILHTGVSADRSTGGFLHINCGSVEIPRRMQQRGVPFLDFETSLEIYVPFCGTAPLDVQTCVGKTLTCDMYVATATGDVSAVIAAGGHPVAYMSGNMAESLPISSAGYGMYLAACKSTWGNGVSQVMNQLTGGTTNTIKNVNQAALNETLSYGQTGGWGQSELLAESYNNPAIGRAMAGAASAKGVAAIGLATTASNVVNAASTGYEQYQRVKNASYTSVSGSFTSCAAWNYPFTPYVKITRPHKQIPTGGTGDYKHTTAIPLVETRNLSGSPGLTTCVNPDVSGIANATAQEKDIIYRALVNGVIV